MAQQMALKGQAFTASAKAPRLTTRAVAVRAASRQQVPLMDRVAPSMLAALVTFSSGFSMMDAVYAPAARADEEEMSPFEKRQAELERRRELLREAREKAAARAAAGTPAAAPEPAAAPAAPAAPSLSNSLQSYQAATQNRPSIPRPKAEPEASTTPRVPKWGGFNFSKPAAEAEKPAEPAAPAKVESGSSSDMGNMFSSDMWNTPIKSKASTPAPAPVTPAPSPFKAPETPKPKAPEPVKPKAPEPAAAKPAAAAKPGKKRGPLPLWFAEVLVLGAYAGLFLAVTKYSKQSSEVLAAVGAKVVEAYKALEKLVASQKQAA